MLAARKLPNAPPNIIKHGMLTAGSVTRSAAAGPVKPALASMAATGISVHVEIISSVPAPAATKTPSGVLPIAGVKTRTIAAATTPAIRNIGMRTRAIFQHMLSHAFIRPAGVCPSVSLACCSK